MGTLGRYVIDTHGHITTLYKAKGEQPKYWNGLPAAKGDGEVEIFDNSPLALYDMDRYGIDMMILKPSVVGTSNESQLKLVEKYPEKFVAYCCDQETRRKVSAGEIEWTVEASAAEIEEALKTGKYVGIGEFLPRNWDPKKVYDFEERLIECRVFMDLARKYDVVVDFHEFAWNYQWNVWSLLVRLALEYPDVNIVVNHAGHSIGSYSQKDQNYRNCVEAAGLPTTRTSNIFLEVGTLPAEYIKLAMEDPNVGPTQLLWGGDYGHVPQYIIHKNGYEPQSFCTAMRKWTPIPSYQIDYFGWQSHQIHKLKDMVGMDEINLLLGGNAAKLYKLPVPHERMFLDGRPDIFGTGWEESIPYIPKNQIMYPDFPDED